MQRWQGSFERKRRCETDSSFFEERSEFRAAQMSKGRKYLKGLFMFLNTPVVRDMRPLKKNLQKELFRVWSMEASLGGIGYMG